jgi:hypothetical protein
MPKQPFSYTWTAFFLVFMLSFLSSTCQLSAQGLKFNVSYDAALLKAEKEAELPSGRLLIAFSKDGNRVSYSDTGPPGGPLLGSDVQKWSQDQTITLDRNCLFFPLESVDLLPEGEYTIQATLRKNKDLSVINAAGNWYSKPVKVKLDSKKGATVEIKLTEKHVENKPADTKTHRFIHMNSPLLTAFHGRPMVVRFGVVLPTDFETNTQQKYPLIVNINGFGGRYTQSRFITPDNKFVQIMLDGAGPFGDCYQVNSANNGPYGDVLVKEIIPYVESNFRCLGTPESRFTTGGSTGGWVSLALQIFYPDVFNGCWSQCPDGVDFRSLELINIYKDKNAYVNPYGFERPSKRNIEGDTIFTVRFESKIERVLGSKNRWELGGLDWASWNATYGPKGSDGLPKPLWNGETGEIDKDVQKHWEQYDLRLVTQRNWKAIGPKLNGKIHIWVGEADDYFLNNGVHHFKTMTNSLTEPKFDGRIEIEIRKPHTSGGWTAKQMKEEMLKRAVKQ